MDAQTPARPHQALRAQSTVKRLKARCANTRLSNGNNSAISGYPMSHIHLPPILAQDPVVIGPLLPPLSEPQCKTYNAALRARDDFANNQHWYFRIRLFTLHVCHNFGVSQRRFLPFSVVDCLADVQKPYSLWYGYECLLTIGFELSAVTQYFKYDADHRFREAGLKEALRSFRRYRLEATHASDVAGLDAAIAESIDQIDRIRSRQRKRPEVA